MDNTLDLTIVNTLDQPMPFDTSEIFDEVSAVVQRSLDESNPDVAFGAGATLIRAACLSGIGLARLAYLIKANWHKYNVDMDFYDAATEAWGLKKITLTRYIGIWEMAESGEVPDSELPLLLQRPMQDLNAIATAFNSGYPISNDKWKELANAESGVEVLELMREIKGAPPRKNTMSLKMARDGTLYVWYQDQVHNLGWLDVGDAEENEVVAKAINRIISGAGIVRE